MRTIEAALTKRMGGTRATIDVEARTATFIFSTDSPDRMGDIIDQKTWQLDRYMQNPVFLWAHKQRELPIAKTIELKVKGGKLIGTVQFATEDENEFAEQCWKLVQGGYLNAVSVGFIPHRWEEYHDEKAGKHGYKLFDCELLECSLVPIPCNQDCLEGAKDLVGNWSKLEAAYRALADNDEDDDVPYDREELKMAIAKSFGSPALDLGTNEQHKVSDAGAEFVYDAAGELMGVKVNGSLKLTREYQDRLLRRNAAAISERAEQQSPATTEKKAGSVSGNFFLRRASARAIARRAAIGVTGRS